MKETDFLKAELKKLHYTNSPHSHQWQQKDNSSEDKDEAMEKRCASDRVECVEGT